MAGTGEIGRSLQQEGGFAYAGIAADQHGGGWNEAAAQHAVQFFDADFGAWRGFGTAGEADEGDGSAGGCLGGGIPHRAGAGDDGFFLDGVPFAAGLAAAGPFGGDGAAGPADEASDGFSHRVGTGVGGSSGVDARLGWVGQGGSVRWGRDANADPRQAGHDVQARVRSAEDLSTVRMRFACSSRTGHRLVLCLHRWS
jgi:hypothetical protein